MKDEEINIGDHVWALMDKQLVIALKTKDGYYLCGGWECVVYFNEFNEVISIIPPPNDAKLFYIFD